MHHAFAAPLQGFGQERDYDEGVALEVGIAPTDDCYHVKFAMRRMRYVQKEEKRKCTATSRVKCVAGGAIFVTLGNVI